MCRELFLGVIRIVVFCENGREKMLRDRFGNVDLFIGFCIGNMVVKLRRMEGKALI